MAQKKVTPEQKKARAVQIGDGMNRAIIEKGKAINKQKCNGPAKPMQKKK